MLEMGYKRGQTMAYTQDLFVKAYVGSNPRSIVGAGRISHPPHLHLRIFYFSKISRKLLSY